MKATKLTRFAAVMFLASLLAGVVIATAAPSLTKSTPVSILPKAEVQVSLVATPTGEFQNGLPVYRLPTIAVTTSRSEELARMAREDALASK